MASMTIKLPSIRGLREKKTVPAGGDVDWTLTADQLKASWWRLSNPGGNEVTICRQDGSPLTADAGDTPIDAGGFLGLDNSEGHGVFNLANAGGSDIDIDMFPYTPGSR